MPIGIRKDSWWYRDLLFICRAIFQTENIFIGNGYDHIAKSVLFHVIGDRGKSVIPEQQTYPIYQPTAN